MTTDVMRAYPDSYVGVIAGKLRYLGVRVMPIINDDGSLAGIVTRSDLLRRKRTVTPPFKPLKNPPRSGPLARDVMTPRDQVKSVSESALADHAADI